MTEKIKDSDSNKIWLLREINSTHKVFTGFDMDHEVSVKYYDALCEFRKDYICEAICDLIRHGGTFPKPKDYVEAYTNVCKRKAEHEKSMVRALPPGPEYADSDIRSVVMSGMFLHYLYNWGEDKLPLGAIKQAYDKMYPGEEFDFSRFKSRITKSTVEKYFEANGYNK